MGHNSATEKQTKTERNESIYKDYKAGLSSVELVKKYGITQTRIFKIIQRFKLQPAA